METENKVRIIPGYNKSNAEIEKVINQYISEEEKNGYKLKEIQHNPDPGTNPVTLLIFELRDQPTVPQK